MKQALKNSYKTILDFWQKAAKLFTQKRTSNILSNAKRPVLTRRSLQAIFQGHSSTVPKAVERE